MRSIYWKFTILNEIDRLQLRKNKNTLFIPCLIVETLNYLICNIDSLVNLKTVYVHIYVLDIRITQMSLMMLVQNVNNLIEFFPLETVISM